MGLFRFRVEGKRNHTPPSLALTKTPTRLLLQRTRTARDLQSARQQLKQLLRTALTKSLERSPLWRSALSMQVGRRLISFLFKRDFTTACPCSFAWVLGFDAKSKTSLSSIATTLQRQRFVTNGRHSAFPVLIALSARAALLPRAPTPQRAAVRLFAGMKLRCCYKN